MDARNNIATDLFYKIRSRFTGLKLGAETGQITINPEEARFFDFDYMEGENPIGHVSISLAEHNSMKVYFSSGITEGMDGGQKDNWYGFLKELRMFAKRRLLAFDTRDIAKDNLDKRDYAFLSQYAQPKPTQNTVQTPVGESIMSESNLYGTKTVSYQKLENTRLIIKHSHALADDMAPGARSRNIAGLFVENQDGERFKYPFIHLSGARAMQRHVANGGKPYDEIGESIIKMSEEIAQLKSFGNYVVRNDLMNSDTNNVVERSSEQLNRLRETIARLAKQGHYEAYKESFQAHQPMEVPQDVVEDFTEKFTVKNFKEDIKSVFPVLYRLMKEANTIGYDDIVAMTTPEAVEEAMPATDAQIDPQATRQYAEKIIKSLDQYTGQDKFEPKYNNDGTITIGKRQDQMWADDVYRKMGRNLNDPDLLRPGALTGANMNKAIDPYFDMFRSKGWRFDQPVAGQFTIGVTKAQQPAVEGDLEVVEHNDPFAAFENWAMSLGEESAIQSQEPDEQQAALQKLQELVGQHFPAGVDGSNAIESLKGIIEDPQLDQAIKAQSKSDPDSCTRGLVKDWLEQNAPETLEQLDFGDYVEEPEGAEQPEAGAEVPAEEVPQEAVDKVEKDAEGNVKSWSHEGDWEKSQGKDPRGKVTHASDVARRRTEKMNTKEIAEFVHSFYDRDSGTFPKGPEGVATMVGKKFGEQAENVARKFVERMAPQQSTEQNPELAELARIKELSGM